MQLCGGHDRGRARRLLRRLLPFARLDHFLNLPLDGVEVERRRRLHRRKLDRRLRQRRHVLLHEDKAPELAGIKVIHVAAAHVVGRFAAGPRRSLERILADVDDRRHVGGHLFAGPAERLLEELELEIVDADGA